jgi:endonuclease III
MPARKRKAAAVEAPVAMAPPTPPSTAKRQRPQRGKRAELPVPVTGGWDELPHGMGNMKVNADANDKAANGDKTLEATTAEDSEAETVIVGNDVDVVAAAATESDAVSAEVTIAAAESAEPATKRTTRTAAVRKGAVRGGKASKARAAKAADKASAEATGASAGESIDPAGSAATGQAASVETADAKIAIKPESEEEKKPLKARTPRKKANAPQPLTPPTDDNDPITRELKEEDPDSDYETMGKKRKRTPRKTKVDTSADVQAKVAEIIEATEGSPKKRARRTAKKSRKTEGDEESGTKPKKTPKKGKANPYGLTPGSTPFPDWPLPTPEACAEVQAALETVHGVVEAPATIPPPSLEVTGCGEVPSVLDALIRTRLSASTTGQNAKYAFQGLVERYGIREEGIGKGSVDWNKVLESETSEIEKAIKRGGLAKTKSVSIKKLLEMVRDINQSRRDAFIAEKEDSSGTTKAAVPGAEKMSQAQKDHEISVADQGVLSMDFAHCLSAEEAMTEFTKFPGIGVKTASCVILFCLQRPSFAVDTHVWRFCKWLKWVPGSASRDQTFSHCEVRVPDEKKYSLHQLFIRHGKTCGRCRAATGEGSEGWESVVCPIEEMVERTGKRKVVVNVARDGKVKVKKAKKKRGEDDEDAESEMSELTDLEGLEGEDGEVEGEGEERDETATHTVVKTDEDGDALMGDLTEAVEEETS